MTLLNIGAFMLKSMSRFVFFMFVFFGLQQAAMAQLSLGNEPPKVKAQLIAEDDSIKPGQKFWVALRQEITPGWHTYWKNPGDTGLATTIKWELPQGFAAEPIAFPTPDRHRIGDLVNFGYDNSVMLLNEIIAPMELKIGETVDLKAKASWLVCQDICIPETAQLELKLKVAHAPAPGAWASAFTAAKTKLPQAHQSTQGVKVNPTTLELTLDPLPLDASEIPEEAYFFPADGLLTAHNAEQKLTLDGRKLRLDVPRNMTRTTPIESIEGDLWLRTVSGVKSFQFHVKPESMPVAPAVVENPAKKIETPVAPQSETQDQIGFLTALLSAFLGGILLNLMPCVFPVLSLKALGLVQKSHHDDRRKVLASGFAYVAGVLVTFTLLGAVIIGLKQAGHQIGWGAQLQSPIFVAALALLLFFIGYALSGAITLGSNLMGAGQSLTQKSGLAGSFFTGALAVVVATPCTAPFMGAAIFYALTQSAIVTLSVLWALGFGLALPYLLLTLFPQILLKYLPRPGVWMEHFKQFLAFPMLAASIWLVWVLGHQNGLNGVAYVLFAMLFLAFALWLWGTTQNRVVTLWQRFKQLSALVMAGLSIMLVVCQPAREMQTSTMVSTETQEAYSPEKLAQYRAANQAVFIDMTAAWCITCLANEKAALSNDTVKQFFADHQIKFLKGDWTNYDENITAFLKQFNRSGVPIYVYYPAGANSTPVVLPQLLTPQIVLNALQPMNDGDKPND